MQSRTGATQRRRAAGSARPGVDRSGIAKVVEEFGRIDILVNNRSWNIGIPFKELDPLTAEIWDRVLETNLRGPFLLARALAPQLRAHGQGRIVNIASTGGLYPSSSSIAYSSSKAGLIHLTRCLAVALAPEVTVNCIAPGWSKNANGATPAGTRSSRARGNRWCSAGAAARRTSPTRSLRFCRAESVTGQVVVVDGGMPGAMR
jgi:3-oxoacyl-[acyl-carrier protein] reductase